MVGRPAIAFARTHCARAVVSIPDAGLRGAVEEALGKSAGEVLTQGELAGLTEFWASDRHIRSLAGLECAVGLEALSLDGNQFTDLSPLAGLTALEYLELRYNQLTDITPLIRNSGLGSGDVVDLGGNPLNDESRNTHISRRCEREA